ncbi:hypothetical protein PRIPAC_97761 [Pristionchus pacificus]|uniref:Uncharacterized protein n=1 Tax=Pristionchus pacificus TaxID=54126 RepID=A0A2A6BCG9_PRIPA|nr:hypothetical protein PRIPAC_97761 [Pristionchus pacificus]|eukprot:PDM63546.1 hypothetical protein PRIPAC_49519 [Pristionchus pacificus]
MKLTSVRKVIHELAHRNMPLAATVVEVVDQLERRHNLARGVFDVTTATGKTWKEIFAEMPDFIYNDETKSYYIYDPDAYDAKSASKMKKKVTRTKKVMSDDDLLDLEFEKMTMGKTITMEELERRRAAALLREREERKEFKESRRGFAGVIPKIVVPIIEEEEEEQ